MANGTRSEILGHASQGGVRQNGGTLPIYECRRCAEAGYPGEQIVWPTSKRTSKRYPVDVSRGYHGQRFYMGHNVHKCDEVQARRAAAIAEFEAHEARQVQGREIVAEAQALTVRLRSQGLSNVEIGRHPEMVEFWNRVNELNGVSV
jgi:hypothetical protein